MIQPGGDGIDVDFVRRQLCGEAPRHAVYPHLRNAIGDAAHDPLVTEDRAVVDDLALSELLHLRHNALTGQKLPRQIHV